MRVIRMKKFAKRLSCCNVKTVKDVIKNASKDELRHLVAHTMDIMKKKISASPQLIKLIRQNRGALRHVVHPQYSLKSKRKYLIQKGAGLSSVMKHIGRSIRQTQHRPLSTIPSSPARGMELRSRTRLPTPGQAERRSASVTSRPTQSTELDPTISRHVQDDGENVLFERLARVPHQENLYESLTPFNTPAAREARRITMEGFERMNRASCIWAPS